MSVSTKKIKYQLKSIIKYNITSKYKDLEIEIEKIDAWKLPLCH